MATCPPSFSMCYEDDHGPTPPFLKRREAETMPSCPALPFRRGMGFGNGQHPPPLWSRRGPPSFLEEGWALQWPTSSSSLK